MQSTRSTAARCVMAASLFMTGAASAQTPLTTTRVAFGLTRPLYVTHAPDDFSKVFIVEQRFGSVGRIRTMTIPDNTLNPTPFLQISPVATGSEQGLLGLAFHPDYVNNGYFWVNYSNSSGTTVIARYQANGPDYRNATTADPASAASVLQIAQPFTNHNGGWIAFGPDGMLYIGMGDGGSANDPGNRAQNINNLLGKMLRIDVDGPDDIPGNTDDDGFPADVNRLYINPSDNPFAGVIPGADEIWAVGLRNPWRNCFDRATGELFIGDVGQNAIEEISYQPANQPGSLPGQSGYMGGRNYGWRCMEGNQCTGLSGCTCFAPELVSPIHTYTHAFGFSITGGYVYRGCAIPDLEGTYFFADFVSSRIWSFRHPMGDALPISDFTERTGELAPGGGFSIQGISSFGEDAAGELYICDLTGGEVFKLIPAAPVAALPPGVAGVTIDQRSWTNADGTFTQRFSDHGEFTIKVTPAAFTADIMWLNAAIDGNWSIQNAPVLKIDCNFAPSGTQSDSTDFALPLPPGTPSPAVNVVFSLTPTQLFGPPVGPSLLLPVTEQLFYAGGTRHAPAATVSSFVPGPAENFINPPSTTTWTKITRSGVEGVKEEVNHCAPGAMARSLAWMNDAYCLGLPADCDEPQEIYDNLKMRMMTTAADGTETKNDDCTASKVVTGVQEFINAKMLQNFLMVLWRPDFAMPAPTPCDLFDAVEAGKDVETEIGWLDGMGNRANGHVITVVGVVKCGTDVTIYYRDDASGRDKQGDKKKDKGVKKAKIVAGGPTGWRLEGKGLGSNQWEGFVAVCPKPLTQLLAIIKWVLAIDTIVEAAQSSGTVPSAADLQKIKDLACRIRELACGLLKQIETLDPPCPPAVTIAMSLKKQAIVLEGLAEFLCEEPSLGTIDEMDAELDSMTNKTNALKMKFDCNNNGVQDDIDIATGASSDANGNGIPDECEPPSCPGDANGDGMVGLGDIAVIIINWNGPGPVGDLDGNGNVGLSDIAIVIVNWGLVCP